MGFLRFHFLRNKHEIDSTDEINANTDLVLRILLHPIFSVSPSYTRKMKKREREPENRVWETGKVEPNREKGIEEE